MLVEENASKILGKVLQACKKGIKKYSLEVMLENRGLCCHCLFPYFYIRTLHKCLKTVLWAYVCRCFPGIHVSAVLSAGQKTASPPPALELHAAYSCERLCWCLGLDPGPLEKHWLPRSRLRTSYSTWKLQRKHGFLMIHKQRGSAAHEFIVEEKILLVTMKVLVALHVFTYAKL